MKRLWAYDRRKCDNEACEMDCDMCESWQPDVPPEPDDSTLEMGFDPYAGCYTDDC